MQSPMLTSPQGNPDEQPRVHYLNANYGLKSWLLTTDHKRIALLYGPDVRPVLPEGRFWLHGPGRLPDGIDGAVSWPLVAWIESHGRPIDGAAPSDGWGRSIALIPGTSQGRPIVMLVSAGPDGFLESAPDTGVRGDDVVRIIG